ncbi:MAG: PIG-L deacetylase family protein [Candidatus Kariarchaeaceae archaeon]|jgi:LmbE family N-acetylglucosaminyl deacetylase
MIALMTIFAHQDDETFSAGGTLASYAEQGGIAVTVSSDPGRREEFNEACRILGVKGIILENEEISATNERQITQQLVELIRTHRPDHVITHTEFDYHHEHRRVRKLVEEAVEWASHTTSNAVAHQVKSLWAAETTVLIPFPEIYIDISNFHDKQMQAIACYETQSHKGGKGFYSKFHSKRTELRGIQAEVTYAEAFTQIPIALAGSFKPEKVYTRFPY